jgi:hypothetical protein
MPNTNKRTGTKHTFYFDREMYETLKAMQKQGDTMSNIVNKAISAFQIKRIMKVRGWSANLCYCHFYVSYKNIEKIKKLRDNNNVSAGYVLYLALISYFEGN